MNATVHAIKAQIITALRTERPRPVDHISQLEAENAALRARVVVLEMHIIEAVGLLSAPGRMPELVASYVDSARRALEQRNEVSR